jgi:hypothetical protein
MLQQVACIIIIIITLSGYAAQRGLCPSRHMKFLDHHTKTRHSR